MGGGGDASAAERAAARSVIEDAIAGVGSKEAPALVTAPVTRSPSALSPVTRTPRRTVTPSFSRQIRARFSVKSRESPLESPRSRTAPAILWRTGSNAGSSRATWSECSLV